MWFEANENLENAVKRNKEEHKHFFKKKVWSVPILDPRFADGANGKVRKQLLAFIKGFDLKNFIVWLKFRYVIHCTYVHKMCTVHLAVPPMLNHSLSHLLGDFTKSKLLSSFPD